MPLGGYRGAGGTGIVYDKVKDIFQGIC